MDDRRCEMCRYLQELSDSCECYRYPPVPVPLYDKVFRARPKVHPHEWCGEWVPREKEDR